MSADDKQDWNVPPNVICDIAKQTLYVDVQLHTTFHEDIIVSTLRMKDFPHSVRDRYAYICESIPSPYKMSVVSVRDDGVITSSRIVQRDLAFRLVIDGCKWARSITNIKQVPPLVVTRLVCGDLDVRTVFPNAAISPTDLSKMWVNRLMCAPLVAMHNDAIVREFKGYYDNGAERTIEENNMYNAIEEDGSDIESIGNMSTDSSSNGRGTDSMSISSNGSGTGSRSGGGSSTSTSSSMSFASVSTTSMSSEYSRSITNASIGPIVEKHVRDVLMADPLRAGTGPLVRIVGHPDSTADAASKARFAGTIYCVLYRIMGQIVKALEDNSLSVDSCRTCLSLSGNADRVPTWFAQSDPFRRGPPAGRYPTPLAFYWRVYRILEGDEILWQRTNASSTMCVICNAIFKITACAAHELGRAYGLPDFCDKKLREPRAVCPTANGSFETIDIESAWEYCWTEMCLSEYHMAQYLRRRGFLLSSFDFNALTHRPADGAGRITEWIVPSGHIDAFALSADMLNTMHRGKMASATGAGVRGLITDGGPVYKIDVSGSGDTFKISTMTEDHLRANCSRIPLMSLHDSSRRFTFAALYPLFLRNYFRGDRSELSLGIRWFAELFFRPCKYVSIMTPDDPCVQHYRLLHVMLGSLDLTDVFDSIMCVYKNDPALVISERDSVMRDDQAFEQGRVRYAERRAKKFDFDDEDCYHQAEIDRRLLRHRYDPLSKKSIYSAFSPNRLVLRTTVPTIYTALAAMLFPRSCHVFVSRRTLTLIWHELVINESLWEDSTELVALLFQVRNLRPSGTNAVRHFDKNIFDETNGAMIDTGDPDVNLPMGARERRTATTRWYTWFAARRSYVDSFVHEHMPTLATSNVPVEWCTCRECTFVKEGHLRKPVYYGYSSDIGHDQSLEEYIRRPLHPSKSGLQCTIPDAIVCDEVQWLPIEEERIYHPRRSMNRTYCEWINSGEYVELPSYNECYPGSQTPPQYLMYRFAADPRVGHALRREIFDSVHGIPGDRRGIIRGIRVNRSRIIDEPTEFGDAMNHIAPFCEANYNTPPRSDVVFRNPDPNNECGNAIRPGGLSWELYLQAREAVPESASTATPTPTTTGSFSRVAHDDNVFRMNYIKWFNEGFPPIDPDTIMDVRRFPFSNIAYTAMMLEGLSALPVYGNAPPPSARAFFDDFYGNGLRRCDVTPTAIISKFDIPHLRSMVASNADMPIGYFMDPNTGNGIPRPVVITLMNILITWRRMNYNIYESPGRLRISKVDAPPAFSNIDPTLLTVMQSLPMRSVPFQTLMKIHGDTINRSLSFKSRYPKKSAPSSNTVVKPLPQAKPPAKRATVKHVI